MADVIKARKKTQGEIARGWLEDAGIKSDPILETIIDSLIAPFNLENPLESANMAGILPAARIAANPKLAQALQRSWKSVV